MNKWINNPIKTQHKVFKTLIEKGKNTAFGEDHKFNSIQTYFYAQFYRSDQQACITHNSEEKGLKDFIK